MRKIFIILILLFAKTAFSQCPENRYYLDKTDTLTFNNEKIAIPRRVFIPDHCRIQFAGEIGFMAIGTGYNFGKSYEATLMIGLQNKFFGNSDESIITVALKNSFNLHKPVKIYDSFSYITSAGASINWGYTNNTFNSLPRHYPDSYYFQNKIHLAPFIGAKLRYDLGENRRKAYRKALEFYAELGVLDAYLLECIRTDYVHLGDVMNLALGVSIYLE